MKASKKLFGAIAALVVAVSLAATTTYAWFTMNRNVEIKAFDLNVKAATVGLWVSTQEDGVYTNSLDLGQYFQDAIKEYNKGVAKDAYVANQRANAISDGIAAAKTTALDAEATAATTGTSTTWSAYVGTLTFPVTVASPGKVGTYADEDAYIAALWTPAQITAAASGAANTFDSTGHTTVEATFDADYAGSKTIYNATILLPDVKESLFAMSDVTYKDSDKTFVNKTGTVRDTTQVEYAVGSVNTTGAKDTFNVSFHDGMVVFDLFFKGTKASDVYLIPTYDGKNTEVAAPAKPAGFKPVRAWEDIDAADTLVDYGYVGDFEKPATDPTPVAGTELDTRAAYASRVMFDNGTPAEMQLWEPNSQAGFGKGARNLAQDFEAAFLGMARPTLIERPSYEAATYLKKDNTIFDAPVFKLATDPSDATNFIAKLTISIWIEGADSDCLNTLFEDIFSTSLIFQANE